MTSHTQFLYLFFHVARQYLRGFPGLFFDPPSITFSSSPYSVSTAEAISYYSGLPSKPLLIYRNGTTPWEEPEAYHKLKEIKPVFSHKIATVWHDLGPKVCHCLDSVQISWTSVDVVRFNIVRNAPGSPILWIGVMPHSLSGKDAHTAAVGCRKLLELYNITDIEVEFRESVFTRFAGPKLLQKLHFFFDPTAGLCSPLTPVLGLQIAAQATPYTEGTGALYISEDNNSDKVYILCPRHVVFPPDAGNNELYNCTNVHRPRHEVLLLGHKAFQTLLRSTMVKIGQHQLSINNWKEQLDDLEKGNVEEQTKIEHELREEEKAINALNQFHDEITKYWSEENQRVLGHVACSPPITVGTGTEQYTEDWALIELDRNKIDWNTFNGNVVDISSKFLQGNFPGWMHFEYPPGGLLPLQGIMEDDELCCPQTLDRDGEACLMVMKNSCTTGVTTGRASGVKSFVREYLPNGRHQTSMEWPILPYNQESGAFSAPGDSGAIIVDGKGRIGGVLTGGTGKTLESPDITYATPFYWIWQRIRTHFPDAHLYDGPDVATLI